MLSGNNSIPSKLFNYLAVGAPILGLAPEKSDLAGLIHAYDVGRNFSNPTVDELLDFFETMSEEHNQSYYRKQSVRAAKDFTKDNAKKIIDNLKL